MPPRTRWLLSALVLLLAACGPTVPVRNAADASPVPGSLPGPQTPPLTDDQLAGQRVVYSYKGSTPPEPLLTAIRTGRAAGVIFFGSNTADPERFRQAVAALRQAQLQSPVHQPLLLMTDQEGGSVRRLPGAPELSARALGAQPDAVAAAQRAGQEAGANLAAAGLNVNLAPVLDVYRDPGNFIDKPQRSFGQDPALVAALGQAFVTGQHASGVAGTAKHFPGLGTAPAKADTDLGPVTLPAGQEELSAVDEAPYAAALVADVDLVMVSWAVYPALDPSRPAGLSPTVVGGELRDRLGFHGVTVTDALEAGALKAYGDTGERAVAAAAAGMDLILCSAQDPAQGADATATLSDALDSGRLDRASFLSAVDRITTLRARLR
ncbi:beta-N-acetylhexosaminidase [Streptomyces tateyamensis]|uniref:Beta-N-acetylhexosaminidase n=1 Tax=Streptomyces tateyamensis TaxID=565073 RepID=A0A2V4NMN3_9ACTN|nr:glycoside hydrolase family 3 N-terminal domain-containing protein [Streptomyces tateyamensis]PYC87392.1 beta-N-acetylhexosaminidase [Streptomyces tateyamensis]